MTFFPGASMDEFSYYFFIITAVFTGLYGIMMLVFSAGWLLQPRFSTGRTVSSEKVSVVIAARNEAGTIRRCLEAIAAQDYPREFMEVVVVDDHSTDQTRELAKEFPFVRTLCLDEGRSGKKEAISKGVEEAAGALVLCTDADCVPGPHWVSFMVSASADGKAALLMGPVAFHQEKGWFGRMQSLEFCGLMGITASTAFFGMPLMCNGANLAYPRKVFLETGGYRGTPAMASGDDVFLMHKLRRQSRGELRFVLAGNAVVCTLPQENWKAFALQRKRWASKVRETGHGPSLAAGGLVLATHLLLPAGLLLAVLYGNFVSHFLLLIGIKCIIDFLFLFLATSFFKKRRLLLLFLPMQFLYPLYLGFVSLMSNSGRYSWKGRMVK